MSSGSRDFRLIVPGDPRPAGRPRFTRTRTGQVITRRDPKDQPARQAISVAWMKAGHPTVTGPYVVLIHAVRPRPASHWTKTGQVNAAGRKIIAPAADVDNLAKLPIDLLVKAGAIDDDRYCLGLTVTKSWAPDPDHPGMLILEVRSTSPWPATEIPTLTWHE